MLSLCVADDVDPDPGPDQDWWQSVSGRWPGLKGCSMPQLRCLETELVFPAASCKQPFWRSGQALKGGFISLGSSRSIFTQWAPERRREQTCFFFFFGLPAGEMENIFSRFESFGDKSCYSEPSS